MKLLIFLIIVFLNTVQLNQIMDSVMQFIISGINIEKIKKLNVNTMCAMQIEILRNNKDIFLEMLDASAKIPYAGMIDSGRTQIGNFDECIGIDRDLNGIRILGKYCFAGLVIPDITNITNIDKYYKLATCIPDKCSAKDLHTIANSLLFEGFPPIILDDFCSTKETGKELSTGNILSLFVIFLIFAIVLFSTIYDIYCQKMGDKAAHPLLLAFSVVTNAKNILKVSRTPSTETIQIFNGFRAISVAWIIAGHAGNSYQEGFLPLMNFDSLLNIMNSRIMSYLYAGSLAVTTFFFMSGFLMSYLYFKRKPQHWLVQVKTIPALYIHRYIRLTVPLLMIYITVLFIAEKIANGPLWQYACENEKNNCRKYWWSYFLYIQNYANWDQLCLIPLWYLSADMQMFILAPLILIPISIVLNRPNGFKLAMVLLASLNVFFVILNIGIREIFPETTENQYGTHERLADYFVGVMMGLFMRFKKEEPFFDPLKKNWITVANLVIWIAVLIPMFCLVLFYEDAVVKFGPTHRTIYYAFGRIIWASGLSWMVYSCYHGYGGFINWILSRPTFQVLGKLSYSMYLIHYLVLGHYTLSNRMMWHLNHYVQFYLFCGYYVETLIVSFIWSLAIESPILTIEKYFFSKAVKPEVTVQANNLKSPESEA